MGNIPLTVLYIGLNINSAYRLLFATIGVYQETGLNNSVGFVILTTKTRFFCFSVLFIIIQSFRSFPWLPFSTTRGPFSLKCDCGSCGGGGGGVERGVGSARAQPELEKR